MPPGAVALERVDVAHRPGPMCQDGIDLSMVARRQAEPADMQVRREVCPVASPDDHRRDSRLFEHPSAGDRRDGGIVALCDRGQGSKQRLEQAPAAEIVDDELVLRQRAVFERTFWFGLTKPPLADETARDR